MAHKGFNTLTQEMKERQIALIEEYAQQGIPMAVIKLNLESAQLMTEEVLAKQLTEEKTLYETQLAEEKEAMGLVKEAFKDAVEPAEV